ncbi:MAG: winged helix-turn-helix domain-containing protein [Candidatus Bathyarchaeia archaeon]
MAKRNDMEICGEVLRVALAGARKSRIVYQANLNFKTVEKYLSMLQGGGLLTSEGRLYRTTEKGSRFLEQYGLMMRTVCLD